MLRRYCRRLLSKPTCTSQEGDRNRATFDEFASVVRDATTCFRQRRQHKQCAPIQFLLAGYCPVRSLPYAATIECGAKSDTALLTNLFQLIPGQPWMIGDVHKSAKEETERLLAKIQKDRLTFERKAGDQINADVETARRGHVQGKQLEEMLLSASETNFNSR